MSFHAAQSASARMNLQAVAIWGAGATSVAANLQALAQANLTIEQAAFQMRKGELCAAYGLAPSSQDKPFAFSGGVAIIPVHGTLINRFAYSFGYVTGYNFLRQQTAAAGLDPDVKLIVYDHNSYGGELAGCLEGAAELPTLANGKPTLAIIDSNCYSASYAWASMADKIVSLPSGGAGSVGVVAMHISFAKLLDKMGIDVTMIHAGSHKVDGNPFEELPKDVKADIQRRVDTGRQAFAELVATGRKMDVKAVLDTEARTYTAQDALSVGFIDAVATPESAVLAYLGELSGSNPQQRNEDEDMSQATTPGAANTQAAQTANTAASTEDLNKIRSDAAAAERSRTAGILQCEEAKGRTDLANHLAFNTSMSVVEAQGILKNAPTAAAAVTNPLAAAMATSTHPNVGAGGDAAAAGESEAHSAGVAGILAAAKAAGVQGIKPKTA